MVVGNVLRGMKSVKHIPPTVQDKRIKLTSSVTRVHRPLRHEHFICRKDKNPNFNINEYSTVVSKPSFRKPCSTQATEFQLFLVLKLQ